MASGTILSRGLASSLRMRMRYCVIFVSRCLFLCTRNLGQKARCSSICGAVRGGRVRAPGAHAVGVDHVTACA